MTKISPNRRKSIAVPNQNKPVFLTRKRRAHSIAPGDHLSPKSKARRSLVPRKSILKASLNIPQDQGDDATQSIEITRDLRTEINDGAARKSLGRRVSFAEHAYVRMFEIPNENTNSTGSPQSSPVAPSSPQHGNDPSQPRNVNDENAYPGAFRRRSSLRRSQAFSDGEGEQSMDMDMDDTALYPHDFLDGSAAQGDEEVEEYDDDDMEMTGVVPGSIVRRRSVVPRRSSVDPHRRPLSTVPPNHNDTSLDEEHADSFSELEQDPTSDQSQPMEFTVPISRALNPPEKNEAWLALRAVTHSGDTPVSHEVEESDGMELESALERLQNARMSLGLTDGSSQEEEELEGALHGEQDSFTSTDDSFGSVDAGDKTLNVTEIRRRQSSIGLDDGEQTMEMTDSYGEQNEGTEDQTDALLRQDESPEELHPREQTENEIPPPSRLPVFQPQPPSQPQPIVFSAPLPTHSSPSKALPTATVPKPFQFSFTPKTSVKGSDPVASSSKKPLPAVRPSAAFALPSPENVPLTLQSTQVTNSIKQPGPVKKPATGTSSTPNPRSLSPSEVAPSQPSSTAKKPSSLSLRRPSGYFAQRKSVGGAFAVPNSKASPAKAAGRASVGGGTAPLSDGVTFDRSEVAKARVRKGKETENQDSDTGPVFSPETLPPRGHEASLAPSANTSDNLVTSTLQDGEHDAMDIQEDVEAVDKTVEAHTDATERWRNSIQPENFVEDEGPPISIEQFFDMTGIRFMDEITAPRRSIHVSQQRPRIRRNSSSPAPDIPLAEYVTAMTIDVPQLELYTYVSRDLQAWVEGCKKIFREAEEEATRMTPDLFKEYSMAEEDVQAELLHQLRLIKANTHGLAKSGWYDWKLQWVEQLYAPAETGFNDLEADARVLEDIVKKTNELVPTLREEYEQALRELEQEQAVVAEIEESDQEYLNELRASIAEQSLEVEALQAEVRDSSAKCERLQDSLQNIEIEEQEMINAIAEARHLIHIQRNSTRAEVFRLRNELEALEGLHMWRATKVQPDSFEFVYGSRYYVSIPCVNFKPLLDEISVSREPSSKMRMEESFPALSELSMQMAKHLVKRRKDISIKMIVQCLRDSWSSCAQLRAQLQLLAIKFPVTVVSIPADDGTLEMKVTAKVVFSKKKAKANVAFIFNMKNIFTWPMSIGSVECDVEVCYGAIQKQIILEAVQGRMGQATPEDNHGCLLDSCMEAIDRYE